MSIKRSVIPKYQESVSVIPGGVIHYLDLGLNLAKAKKLATEFYEHAVTTSGTEKPTWQLICLSRLHTEEGFLNSQTGERAVDPTTNQAITESMLSFSAEKALEPFLDQWVPLPFFRSEGAIDAFTDRYRFGPTDWARIYVSKLAEKDEKGNTHRMVIALDTQVQDGIDISNVSRSEGYPSICSADVQDLAEFKLVSDVRYNDWFLALDWVDEWLREFFFDFMRRNRPAGRIIQEEDFPYRTEHMARYIAFIELINSSARIPSVRLIDPTQTTPIDVDLVLDIGNSRTIGLLIERVPGDTLSLKNGSVLELRDLNQPIDVQTDTFNTHICFSKAHFGDSNGYSRGAGRSKPSFSWPSVIRTGSEANRLAANSKREQGQTSMSSPKRYLWDLKPRIEEWRFVSNSKLLDAREMPVTTGAFVGGINNEGIPLGELKKNLQTTLGLTVLPNIFAVTDPKFSRSSLMMFLLSEILSHALVQMNSPAYRGQRLYSDLPRRLKNLILTIPPAMSVSERKIYERWVRRAIDVLWRAMRWDTFSENPSDYRTKPQTRVNLDEASATQLVFVYNEIAQKFSGDSAEYFDIYGRARANRGTSPSLRVASIDIGGGTTDMVITTYINQPAGATNIVAPRQEFREGFNCAGDDILKVIIEKHLIPSLIEYVDSVAGTNCRQIIQRKLGHNVVVMSQQDRNMRSQFAQQVLMPCALRIMQSLEATACENLHASILNFTLEAVLQQSPTKVPAEVLEFIEGVWPTNLANNPSLQNWPIHTNLHEVAATVTDLIRPYLSDLSEIIASWHCDFVVLSGRPSCVPAIQAILRQAPPVEPSRIIPMSEYDVGSSWYPFWTVGGKIKDPKTTGVVGAALSVVSEGADPNFHFRSRDLKPASTIRYMGPMEPDRKIYNRNLFFQGSDLSTSNEEELTDTFHFSRPMYIGFRQLKIERWKTTPFYFVDFSSNPLARERAQRRGAMPYNITFSYKRNLNDDENVLSDGEIEGVIRIEEILTADGTNIPKSDIELRLKSLWSEDGHWLDTGSFDI
jgi:hypothetical protein